MAAFEKALTARSARIGERRQQEADKYSLETHKADLKYKGLMGEKIVDEMAREKRKAAKTARIGALTGEYVDAPDQAARVAAGAGLMEQDPDALKAAQGLYAGRQTQNKAAQDQQTELFTNSFQVARGMPEEQRGEAYQAMIGKAVQMGVATEEEADQLSNIAQADPQQFEQVMERVLGITPDKKTLKPVEMPDGSIRYQTTENAEGAIVGRQQTETGEPGSFGTDKKEVRDFKATEISTRNALDTIDSTLGMLETNPDAFTTVADLAGMASGLATEVEAGARAMGMNISPAVRDLNSYASTFEDLGIQGSRAQGAVLDLSLAYAAAIGLGTGRSLTEKDVERALKRVGAGGLRTPKARRAMMEDVRTVIQRNFVNSYEVILGQPYEGDLGGRMKTNKLEAGTERGGYRFKGGDPKDKGNWEKVGG